MDRVAKRIQSGLLVRSAGDLALIATPYSASLSREQPDQWSIIA
jgi:hypothetical protein